MSTQHIPCSVLHHAKKIAGVEKRMPMLIGVVHDDDVEKRGWMKKINERKKICPICLKTWKRVFSLFLEIYILGSINRSNWACQYKWKISTTCFSAFTTWAVRAPRLEARLLLGNGKTALKCQWAMPGCLCCKMESKWIYNLVYKDCDCSSSELRK